MAGVRSKKLVEGKTKIIWEDSPATVMVESKDAITAGDGARKEQMVGKAALATTTTCHVFELLDNHGIPNHYIGQASETVFAAFKVDMIPIELVARRLAFGSYLKRNPTEASGRRFDEPVIEFFHKDDANHDPLLTMDRSTGRLTRHAANKPVGEAILDTLPEDVFSKKVIDRCGILADLTKFTFKAVEAAWQEQDVALVDMKIECGFDNNGHLLVADVIDNDSWRIWPEGDPTQMKDKQLFRDGKPMGDVMDSYRWVAEQTRLFVG